MSESVLEKLAREEEAERKFREQTNIELIHLIENENGDFIYRTYKVDETVNNFVLVKGKGKPFIILTADNDPLSELKRYWTHYTKEKKFLNSLKKIGICIGDGENTGFLGDHYSAQFYEILRERTI